MRPELEKIQYIEQYLEGKLPSDEAQTFKAEIESNPVLKSEVELQKQLTQRIQRAALKEQLENIHQKQFGKQKKAWWKNVWLNIVVIAFLIGGGLFLIPQNEEGYISEEVPTVVDSFETITPAYESELPTDSCKIDSSAIDSSLYQREESIIEEKTNYAPPSKLKAIVDAEEIESDFVENESKEITENINAFNEKEDSTTTKDAPEYKWECLNVPFDTVEYDQSKGVEFKYSRSETKVSLPPNLIDVSTWDMKTPIKILYKEYRNAAEIVYSGIPMMVEYEGEMERFNSGGMFELASNIKGLKMDPKAAEKIKIDFALANDVDGLDYYALKEETWKKTGVLTNKIVDRNKCEGTSCTYKIDVSARKLNDKEIDWNQINSFNIDSIINAPKLKGIRAIAINSKLPWRFRKDKHYEIMVIAQLPELNIADTFKIQRTGYFAERLANHYYRNPSTFKPAYDKFNQLRFDSCETCYKKQSKTKVVALPLAFKTGKSLEPTANIVEPDPTPLNEDSVYKDVIRGTRWRRKQQLANNNKSKKRKKLPNYTVIGRGGMGKSPIVQGLKTMGFGVYNIDAISKVKNKVSLRPQFDIDKEEIKMVKVVDLKVNAAFSSNPYKIVINEKSPTVLLVFTNSGKLKFVDSKTVDFLKNNPKASVTSIDITQQINSTEELKTLLDKELKKVED